MFLKEHVNFIFCRFVQLRDTAVQFAWPDYPSGCLVNYPWTSVSHFWSLLSCVNINVPSSQQNIRSEAGVTREFSDVASLTSVLFSSRFSQHLACHMMSAIKHVLLFVLCSRLEEQRGILNVWWGSMSSISFILSSDSYRCTVWSLKCVWAVQSYNVTLLRMNVVVSHEL